MLSTLLFNHILKQNSKKVFQHYAGSENTGNEVFGLFTTKKRISDADGLM